MPPIRKLLPWFCECIPDRSVVSLVSECQWVQCRVGIPQRQRESCVFFESWSLSIWKRRARVNTVFTTHHSLASHFTKKAHNNLKLNYLSSKDALPSLFKVRKPFMARCGRVCSKHLKWISTTVTESDWKERALHTGKAWPWGYRKCRLSGVTESDVWEFHSGRGKTVSAVFF